MKGEGKKGECGYYTSEKEIMEEYEVCVFLLSWGWGGVWFSIFSTSTKVGSILTRNTTTTTLDSIPTFVPEAGESSQKAS